MLLSGLLLAGCERAMHDMYDQRRYKPLAPSDLFADGRSSRPLVPGTVVRSRGALAGSSSGRAGERPLPRDIPYPITQALLRRGQERFTIYCAPCHGPVGDGDGMVARRGFPHPPSYHSERLRNAPDVHFFAVITEGYGAMYPYADRVAEDDRWAIIAYIRALQLSQHMPIADLPEDVRARIETGP